MAREDRERALLANWRAYKEQMYDLIEEVDHQLAVARTMRRQRQAAAVRIVRKTWPNDYDLDLDDVFSR